MSAERVEEIFSALVDSGPERRATVLANLCGNNGEVHAEVESLLAAADRAKGFLSVSPVGPLFSHSIHPQALLGRRIGPYRLLRELGRGGMGAVFLAQQADGQYRQQVAIKLAGSGLYMEALLQRFYTERQILANLEHPNIARLLDGGSTDDGLPYLVMEYIRGVPIDVFCQARRLSLPNRIQLVCAVCSAVQYAHRNLVIHRDLKPDNILVTPSGVPKLLDFGAAKLLTSRGAQDSASPTRNNAAPLTPEFAAPEQINGAPITAATDVYALGVILYQLLTGKRPYEFSGESLANIVHTVCETKPVPPSSVAPWPSQARLRGDLDSIILRALRKEPEERYASVQLFAEDLERYLSGLPTRAAGLRFATAAPSA